jgi:hypothetical protein
MRRKYRDDRKRNERKARREIQDALMEFRMGGRDRLNFFPASLMNAGRILETDGAPLCRGGDQTNS